MSELINNAEKRKELLKHMILQLHEGEAPEQVKKQLIRLMGQVPYSDVVLVEQELISEGLPVEEVLKLCDIHTVVLEGNIDQSGAKDAPDGHPVHTFRKENEGIEWEISAINTIIRQIEQEDENADVTDLMMDIRQHINNLMDVEKHYAKKENLLFPFMEKHEITGPPKVMWGKHDETRELLKAAVEGLQAIKTIDAGEAKSFIELVIKPTLEALQGMIYKEEEILFPMVLDTLNDDEWYEIYRQSLEYGFCLYDPKTEWKPENIDLNQQPEISDDRIQLPSGSFTTEELTAILNTIPFDLTFVDKDDKVRYFTQGEERIFARSRAILGRDVALCHPPSSVHIVEKILEDFKSGAQNRARFWINMNDNFIMIEYYALRNKNGEYLGTLEVSQNLTEKRNLTGERRLLEYD
ncbi:MAG: DUF438 domain-containing protein [Calditrichia bacterium]